MIRGILVIIALTMVATLSAQQQNSFPVDSLLSAQAKSERAYLRFLDNTTLSSGIYVLEKGAEDRQSPHDLDEIYYVLSGHSKMVIDQKEFHVKKGDILFVPAFAEHKFVDIQEDLKLLVFFSKKPPK